MNKSNSIILLYLMLFSASALALPDGYQGGRLELPDPPLTESAVFAFDSLMNLYYGHAGVVKSRADIKSGRGASSEIWKYNVSSGTHTLFYESPAVSAGDYGINSATAIWVDETAMPRTFYIADQEPVKGDPWTTGAVWRARDINDDGDINDSGEIELWTTDVSILVYVTDLIRDDLTGEVFVTNSEGIGGNPMVYRLSDTNASGWIETGEFTGYANLPQDYQFAGGLCFGSSSGVIFTHDTSGSVYRLEDLDNDHSATGPGEMFIYAALPIAGAFDIEMDPDDDLFVTASDWGTMIHGIYQITTGTSPEVTLFHDLSADIGSCGKLVFGPSAPFEPYVSGGAVLYMNYTSISWTDPTDIMTFQAIPGSVITPTMSVWGLILLLGMVSILVVRNSH